MPVIDLLVCCFADALTDATVRRMGYVVPSPSPNITPGDFEVETLLRLVHGSVVRPLTIVGIPDIQPPEGLLAMYNNL